jgi:hypothetical protein
MGREVVRDSELVIQPPPAAAVPRRPPRLVRLDLRGIDAREFGDAAGQRAEFHGLEEGDQELVVGLVHR